MQLTWISSHLILLALVREIDRPAGIYKWREGLSSEALLMSTYVSNKNMLLQTLELMNAEEWINYRRERWQMHFNNNIIFIRKKNSIHFMYIK